MLHLSFLSAILFLLFSTLTGFTHALPAHARRPAAIPAATTPPPTTPPATTPPATTIAGKATFFYQLGQPGFCGAYNPDSAYIVALSPDHYTGTTSPCGRSVKVTATNGPGIGRSLIAQVADECIGCTTSHIDLAVAPFEYLTNGQGVEMGVVQVDWSFV